MPYISQERRQEINDGDYPIGVGELNFILTSMCLEFLGPSEDLRYEDYNDVVGVLECVKQEFYRRMVAEYEDRKIEENGDVF